MPIYKNYGLSGAVIPDNVLSFQSGYESNADGFLILENPFEIDCADNILWSKGWVHYLFVKNDKAIPKLDFLIDKNVHALKFKEYSLFYKTKSEAIIYLNNHRLHLGINTVDVIKLRCSDSK